MQAVSLINGRVLGPEGALDVGDVHVANGLIVERASGDARRLDCEGLYVLPGLIDVHGDQFEREIHPRPGVVIPFDVALRSVDRLLIANGITTAFHGLTLSWEPGQRSVGAGRRFMAALLEARSGFLADHRVQLRWETFAFEAAGDVMGWLNEAPRPALAFNDHTTATLEKVAAGTHHKLEQWAARAGVSSARYLELVDEAATRQGDVGAMIARMAAAAQRVGAVMLAHDLTTSEEQVRFRDLGVTVAEFPLAEGVAGTRPCSVRPTSCEAAAIPARSRQKLPLRQGSARFWLRIIIIRRCWRPSGGLLRAGWCRGPRHGRWFRPMRHGRCSLMTEARFSRGSARILSLWTGPRARTQSSVRC